MKEQAIEVSAEGLTPLEDMTGRQVLYMPWTGNEDWNVVAQLFGADAQALAEGRLHDTDVIVAEILTAQERIIHRDAFELKPCENLGYTVPHFRDDEIEGVSPLPPYVADLRKGTCYVRFIVPKHCAGRFLIFNGKGESWSFPLVEPKGKDESSGLIAVAYRLQPLTVARCLAFNLSGRGPFVHRAWLNHGHPVTRTNKTTVFDHGASFFDNVYDAWGVIESDLYRPEIDGHGKVVYDDEGFPVESQDQPYRAPTPYELEGSWQIVALGRDLHVFTLESQEEGRILLGDRSRRIYT